MATESKPSSTWTRESAPSVAFSLEALPTRPGSVDGFWTDGTSDGFYDEYPLDGFYGSIGYTPEFRPQRRATVASEQKPSTTFTLEGKP